MESKDKSKEESALIEELRLKLRKKLADLIHHPAASKETREDLSRALESLVK